MWKWGGGLTMGWFLRGNVSRKNYCCYNFSIKWLIQAGWFLLDFTVSSVFSSYSAIVQRRCSEVQVTWSPVIWWRRLAENITVLTWKWFCKIIYTQFEAEIEATGKSTVLLRSKDKLLDNTSCDHRMSILGFCVRQSRKSCSVKLGGFAPHFKTFSRPFRESESDLKKLQMNRSKIFPSSKMDSKLLGCEICWGSHTFVSDQ